LPDCSINSIQSTETGLIEDHTALERDGTCLGRESHTTTSLRLPSIVSAQIYDGRSISGEATISVGLSRSNRDCMHPLFCKSPVLISGPTSSLPHTSRWLERTRYRCLDRSRCYRERTDSLRRGCGVGGIPVRDAL